MNIITSENIRRILANVEAGMYNKKKLLVLIENIENNRGKYPHDEVEFLIQTVTTYYLNK